MSLIFVVLPWLQTVPTELFFTSSTGNDVAAIIPNDVHSAGWATFCVSFKPLLVESFTILLQNPVLCLFTISR